MGSLDQAITDFNKAIELKPDYAKAYYNRGITNLLKGDAMVAVADFNKAIQLSNDAKLIESARQRIEEVQKSMKPGK
jgi:Flp pilus assembly protein TadD